MTGQSDTHTCDFLVTRLIDLTTACQELVTLSFWMRNGRQYFTSVFIGNCYFLSFIRRQHLCARRIPVHLVTFMSYYDVSELASWLGSFGVFRRQAHSPGKCLKLGYILFWRDWTASYSAKITWERAKWMCFNLEVTRNLYLPPNQVYSYTQSILTMHSYDDFASVLRSLFLQTAMSKNDCYQSKTDSTISLSVLLFWLRSTLLMSIVTKLFLRCLASEIVLRKHGYGHDRG